MTNNFAQFIKNMTTILVENGPELLITLLGLIVLHFIVRGVMKKFARLIIIRVSKKVGMSTEQEKRITTINALFTRIAFVLLWGVGIIVILGELNINIAPILTGLGIFGLALSFGAQSLVKDLIAGIFILIENQIRVGDVAVINGTGGLVESIDLRTIVLRDSEGIVHVFPNGLIRTLSNTTKDWSACVLDISVAYKEDLERVEEIMKEVGEDLRGDKEFGRYILKPIEIFGIEKLSKASMVIRIRIKTQPLKQWMIAREYRLRLKKAFDKHDIVVG
ncbi:mechanosensitive ion channel family protein [candidate division WOR-3 bacterium]|nr:mechanosensitive ion channel family protein [candidate division WOR-3 bacterium]